METIKSYLFKWNNLEKVWSFNFYSYLENRQYCDCSLAAEGKFISAHKIILSGKQLQLDNASTLFVYCQLFLSACSDYFREMFELGDQQPSRIIVLADVTYEDLISVLEFAYKGEVMVKSENYERFLKVAKLLQLKGISDRTSVLPPTAPLSPPPVISLPDRSLTSEIIESSLELELPEIKTESESSPVRKGLKRKAQSIGKFPKPLFLPVLTNFCQQIMLSRKKSRQWIDERSRNAEKRWPLHLNSAASSARKSTQKKVLTVTKSSANSTPTVSFPLAKFASSHCLVLTSSSNTWRASTQSHKLPFFIYKCSILIFKKQIKVTSDCQKTNKRRKHSPNLEQSCIIEDKRECKFDYN